MFTQSVSWEKTSNMQFQDELYSFLGDRARGFHSSVVRRIRRVAVGRLYFFLQTIFNAPGKRAIPFPFQITKISWYERVVKIKQ